MIFLFLSLLPKWNLLWYHKHDALSISVVRSAVCSFSSKPRAALEAKCSSKTSTFGFLHKHVPMCVLVCARNTQDCTLCYAHFFRNIFVTKWLTLTVKHSGASCVTFTPWAVLSWIMSSQQATAMDTAVRFMAQQTVMEQVSLDWIGMMEHVLMSH